MSEGELNDANLTKNSLKSENLADTRPKITNSAQAYEVGRSIIQDNKKRIRISSKIQEQYDSIKPPISPAKLAEQGKSHKSNVMTGYMLDLINKSATHLIKRVKRSKYLTTAHLPSGFEGASEKTEFFRSEFTTFLKKWKPFHTFLNSIVYETVIHGKTSVAWTNKNQWAPEFFRGDKAFIPDGTTQGEDPKILVIKHNFKVNELVDFIRNDNASDVGWDIENCIKEVNLATKTSRAKDDEGTREFDDVLRELTTTDSFRSGVKEIETLIVFVEELSGKVSKFIVTNGGGQELYTSHEKFDSMSYVWNGITYQHGNGTFHGSYGVGQLVYDLSLLVEKTRNQVIDSLLKRGRFNIRVNDEKDIKKAKLMITDESNILAVGTFAGNEAQIPDASAAFGLLDRELSSFGEKKVGVMTPRGPVEGNSNVAANARIDQQNEEETRDGIEDHFLVQFNFIISTILHKIFVENAMEPSAQKLRAVISKRLTPRDIQAIVASANTYTSYDHTDANTKQKIEFLNSRKGDPAYNQLRLEKTLATLILGKEDADDLIIPERDENLTTVASNKQLDEILSITNGLPIMAEMADNDLVHMDVLKGKEVEENVRYDGFIFKALESGDLPTAKALYSHYSQHFDNSLIKKTIGERNNEEKHFQKIFLNALKKMEAEVLKQQQQVQQAQQQEAQIAQQQELEALGAAQEELAMEQAANNQVRQEQITSDVLSQ